MTIQIKIKEPTLDENFIIGLKETLSIACEMYGLTLGRIDIQEDKKMSVDVKALYGEARWDWYDYQPMLEAFGKIAIQVDDSGYQGDSRLLYDENGKIGYLIFGWGSCTVCDALQSCDSLEDVQELCDKLQGDIKWFDSKREALEWFTTHDWEGDFSWYMEETKEFVRKCIEYLQEDKQ